MSVEGLLVTFVTTLLGSGAAFAGLRLFFDHHRDKKSRDDTSRHLSLVLAFQLEDYAIDCAKKVSDHKDAVEHNGAVGKLIGAVPFPPSLPTSSAYPQFPSGLLHDVLDFPQRCKMANESAIFWWDYLGDNDSCNTAMEEHTLRMAQLALKIAEELRAAFKLQNRNLTFGTWDLKKYLHDELQKHLEREEELDKSALSVSEH